MQKDKKDLTLIEIGTGAGNIAVSIAYYTKNTSIIATDISNEAIEAAKKNIDMYDFDDRISLVCGDVFEPLKDKNLEGSVDMVVCNPPYIPTKSLTNLAPEIIDHEPEVALNAGPYGIDIFNKLIKEAVIFLRDQGVLIFEIGVGQEKLVNMLFKKNKGYDNIQHIDDGENVRVISALKSSSASTSSR